MEPLPLWCDICCQRFSGSISAQQHFQSSNHMRKEKNIACYGKSGLFCQVCHILCDTGKMLRSHESSPRHLAMVQKQQQLSVSVTPASSETSLYEHDQSPARSTGSLSQGREYVFNGSRGYCYLCAIDLTSEDHATSHINGRNHMKKKRQRERAEAHSKSKKHKTKHENKVIRNNCSTKQASIKSYIPADFLNENSHNNDEIKWKLHVERSGNLDVISHKTHTERQSYDKSHTNDAKSRKSLGAGEEKDERINDDNSFPARPNSDFDLNEKTRDFESIVKRHRRLSSDSNTSGTPSDGSLTGTYLEGSGKGSFNQYASISEDSNISGTPSEGSLTGTYPEGSSKGAYAYRFSDAEYRGWCNVCNIDLTSEIHKWQHVFGRKHNKAREVWERGVLGPYKCNVCYMVFAGPEPQQQHFNSKKHKDRVKRYGKEGPEYFCDICKVPCSGEVSYSQHLAGAQHIKMSGEVGNRSIFTGIDQTQCHICKCQLNTIQQLYIHQQSPRHLAKAQKLQACGIDIHGEIRLESLFPDEYDADESEDYQHGKTVKEAKQFIKPEITNEPVPVIKRFGNVGTPVNEAGRTKRGQGSDLARATRSKSIRSNVKRDIGERSAEKRSNLSSDTRDISHEKSRSRVPLDLNEIPKTKMKPRSYQVELFRRSLVSNTLCFLPTGTGKTLVSVLTMCRMLQEFPSKNVLFLVDKVLLMQQQSKFIKQQIGDNRFFRYDPDSHGYQRLVKRHLNIAAVCMGQQSTNGLPMRKNDVVIATAGFCKNLLDQGRVKWSDFSLVVFDEAHHCEKRHPFNTLLLEYHSKIRVPEKLPKVLGLTASPAGKSDLHKTIVMLEKLLANMGHSKMNVVEEPENVAMLKAIQSNAEIIVKVLDKGDNSESSGNEQIKNLLGSLLKELLRANDGNQSHGRKQMSLVLVKKRSTAHKLCTALNRSIEMQKRGLKCVYVVGHGSSGAAYKGMSVAQQKQVLKEIKRHKYQVVIATSVAEEGVDWPECDCVISIYPPSTVTALVQMRGRARMKHSKFIILCESEMERKKLQDIRRREEHMIEATRIIVQRQKQA